MPTTAEASKCQQCGGYGFDAKANEICKRCNGTAIEPNVSDWIEAKISRSVFDAIKGTGTSPMAKKTESAEVYIAWIIEYGKEPIVSAHNTYNSAERYIASFAIDQLHDDDVDTGDMSSKEAIRRHFENTGDVYDIKRREVYP